MTPDQSTEKRMGAMENQLREVLASLKHINDNMATKDEMASIQADVAETKQIVAAWKSVRWLGGAVQSISKMLVALAAIGAVVWAMFRFAVGRAI